MQPVPIDADDLCRWVSDECWLSERLDRVQLLVWLPPRTWMRGGLLIDRFRQLAEAHNDGDLADRIVISETHDFDEQREAVRDASEIALRVDLVVLDSSTSFYRLERTIDEDGKALRTVARQLTSLSGWPASTIWPSS